MIDKRQGQPGPRERIASVEPKEIAPPDGGAHLPNHPRHQGQTPGHEAQAARGRGHQGREAGVAGGKAQSPDASALVWPDALNGPCVCVPA